MSDDARAPRGRPSREYDFRRWGESGTEKDEAGLTDTGQRPSPWPRDRTGEETGEGEPAVSYSEVDRPGFDHAAGAAAIDEPHKFDISTYREGLYGGPGADLIGDSAFGNSWDPPSDEPDIPVAREHSLELDPVDPQQFESQSFESQSFESRSFESQSFESQSFEQEPNATPAESSNSLVRPYFRTGGRTRSDYNLAIEALVSTSAQGMRSFGQVSPEQQSICGLCVDTRSVAEVAAHMRLPLGVAKVLIGDMAGMGLVMVHQSSAVVGDRPSMEFLERVLSGLRRL